MMLSPGAVAMWEALKTGPSVRMSVAELREIIANFEAPTVEPEGVTYADAGAVEGLWAIPSDPRDRSAMLYIYGGGFICGTPASRRKTAGHLANAARTRVLVPSYRLSPEHPYPAALHDARHAYDWLLTQDVDPQRLVVGGDSAGAGLAISLMLALRDDGRPLPAGTVLISPWADMTCSGESMDTRAEFDVTCTRDGILGFADMYLAGHDPRDPSASPVLADLSGLPPVLALAGSSEVLLDDAVRLVRGIGEGGADATLVIGGEMQHVWPVWFGAFPEATQSIGLIGRWILDHT